jgi:hypothetical protein
VIFFWGVKDILGMNTIEFLLSPGKILAFSICILSSSTMSDVPLQSPEATGRFLRSIIIAPPIKESRWGGILVGVKEFKNSAGKSGPI